MFADWAAGVNATPDRETVERYVDGMVEVCQCCETILFVFMLTVYEAAMKGVLTNFSNVDDSPSSLNTQEEELININYD